MRSNIKRLPLSVFLILIIILCLSFSLIAVSPSMVKDNLKISQEYLDQLKKVKVKSVIDGDTFVINTGESVRIIGVDTPEIYPENFEKKREYFSKKASDYTKKFLENKYKWVYLEYGQEKRDKYNRFLAYVYLPDGTFFNAKLLRDGYAYLLTVPPNIKYIDIFKKEVAEARNNRRGLWSSRFKTESEVPVISWENADKYLGNKVIVEGKIVDTYDSGETIFLNFSKNYRHTLTGVIFQSDKYKFITEPEVYYQNKNVRIIGKVKEYEGSPEIIINQPSQISIVESSGKK